MVNLVLFFRQFDHAQKTLISFYIKYIWFKNEMAQGQFSLVKNTFTYFYLYVDHEGLQHYSNKNRWLQKFRLPKEPRVESQYWLEEGSVSVFVCKAGGGGREDCSAGLHNLFLISTPSTINCATDILTSCCTLLPFLYSLDYQVRHETSVHTLGLQYSMCYVAPGKLRSVYCLSYHYS